MNEFQKVRDEWASFTEHPFTKYVFELFESHARMAETKELREADDEAGRMKALGKAEGLRTALQLLTHIPVAKAEAIDVRIKSELNLSIERSKGMEAITQLDEGTGGGDGAVKRRRQVPEGWASGTSFSSSSCSPKMPVVREPSEGRGGGGPEPQATRAPQEEEPCME